MNDIFAMRRRQTYGDIWDDHTSMIWSDEVRGWRWLVGLCTCINLAAQSILPLILHGQQHACTDGQISGTYISDMASSDTSA